MRYLVYVQAGQMVVRSTQSRTKTQVGRIDAAMAGGNVICDKEW